MSQTFVLLLIMSGVAAAACSGGDGPSAAGTPGGERGERDATVVEEQAESVAVEQQQVSPEVEAEVVEEAAQVEQAAEAAGAEEAIEAEVEDASEQTITFDEELVERIAAGLAEHRAGLMVERNVLGDPAAPVLIVEYGDFQ